MRCTHWLPLVSCVLLFTSPLCLAGEQPSAASGAASAETPPDADKESKSEKMTADVVYVATPHDVVDRMLRMAQVEKDDVVYDLGCGDGRIVIAAARRFGCKAVGFDIDDDRIEESRENVRRAGIGNLVDIRQKDIFTLDLSKANVITSYLLPKMNVKLIPQFEKMKPGSRIVCHDYGIKGVEPAKVHEMTSNEDGVEHTVYLYKVPLEKKE